MFMMIAGVLLLKVSVLFDSELSDNSINSCIIEITT